MDGKEDDIQTHTYTERHIDKQMDRKINRAKQIDSKIEIDKNR